MPAAIGRAFVLDELAALTSHREVHRLRPCEALYVTMLRPSSPRRSRATGDLSLPLPRAMIPCGRRLNGETNFPTVEMRLWNP